MCEASENLYPHIPKNADKIMFAEDFVNYALFKFNLPSLPSITEIYRPMVYNAFNPAVRDAVNFLFTQLETEYLEEFCYIFRQRPLDRKAFDNYVAFLVTKYLGSDFDAQRWLYLCVKITTMALKFYCNGFREGPSLVMQYIISTLENYDMKSGGWEQVNFIALNYARIYTDIGKHLESVYGSGSASNSESNFSETTNQVTASDAKYGFAKKLTQHSSGGEYSKAPPFKVPYIGGMYGNLRNYTPKAIPFLPSRNIPSCSKARNIFDFDVETSSSGEGKPAAFQQDIASPVSVFMDETEEYDSDVCILDTVPSCNKFGSKSAKKRPASFSSSTVGFPVLAAVERSDVSLHSPSVCHENLNAPSTESANSVGTNLSMSPEHEQPSKVRKQF